MNEQIVKALLHIVFLWNLIFHGYLNYFSIFLRTQDILRHPIIFKLWDPWNDLADSMRLKALKIFSHLFLGSVQQYLILFIFPYVLVFLVASNLQ